MRVWEEDSQIPHLHSLALSLVFFVVVVVVVVVVFFYFHLPLFSYATTNGEPGTG